MRQRLTAFCAGIALMILALATGGDVHAMSDPTPRTDRHFGDAPRDVTAIARQIELGEVPEAGALAALATEKEGAGLDARYGDNITLLFHALTNANIPAIEALLRAGADVRVPDAPGSGRDFVDYMALPGGDAISPEQVAQIISAYLAAGGDPNVAPEPGGETLLDVVTSRGNTAAAQVLLEAGADPWATRADKTSATGNSPATTAALMQRFEVLEMLIAQDALTGRSQAELERFFERLDSHAQRGDALSLQIREVAKRVLKRNPDYRPPDTGRGTQSIFKDHYNDPGAGEIPWDEITSGAVE